MSTLTLGIICGIAAATGQCLAYLLARGHRTDRRAGHLVFLTVTHVEMGLISALLAALLWRPGVIELRPVLLPASKAMVAYLLAQTSLFYALRWTEPSRVSPMLALKIVFLAILGSTLSGIELSLLQWLAIVMAFVGARIIHSAGGRMPWPGVLGAVGACLGYAFSDLSIREVNALVAPLGTFRGPFFGCALCYVLCGLVTAALLPVFRSDAADWIRGARYSAVWLVAMGMLFACFAFIGVIAGNIVQSSRGLISVLLAVLIAKLGHVGIEADMSSTAWLRRGVAAVLMVAAIVSYLLG